MAKFDVTGFDKLLAGLSNIDCAKVMPKMVKEAAPILETNLVSNVSAHNDTGAMAASIGLTPVRKAKDGYRMTVRPTGTDAKGVRNMEKMVYMEYGTYKQSPTPVLSPAVAESESACIDAMEKVFQEYTKEIQL